MQHNLSLHWTRIKPRASELVRYPGGNEMAVKEVLLLGNPQLYEVSTTVLREEIDDIRNI